MSCNIVLDIGKFMNSIDGLQTERAYVFYDERRNAHSFKLQAPFLPCFIRVHFKFWIFSTTVEWNTFFTFVVVVAV